LGIWRIAPTFKTTAQARSESDSSLVQYQFAANVLNSRVLYKESNSFFVGIRIPLALHFSIADFQSRLPSSFPHCKDKVSDWIELKKKSKMNRILKVINPFLKFA
jgi:hypothetical protein